MIYRVAQGELEIEHCHIERIWANIFTKPLQGKAFRELKAELINCPVDYEEESTHEDSGNNA